jgi:hypothetical protein
MPIEYVYALHDFEPLNDDEIAFVAGERIEVLERDDAYGDGWWTVSYCCFNLYADYAPSFGEATRLIQRFPP